MQDETNTAVVEFPPLPEVTTALLPLDDGPLSRAAALIDWDAWRAEIAERLAEDPYFIGSRYVENGTADGFPRFDPIPLTLDDLLDGREEDHVMQNDPHAWMCWYLMTMLRVLWAEHDIHHDHCINWGVLGLGNHGPDIAVFDRQRAPRLHRATLYVTEATRAVLTMEVTSLSTMFADFITKLRAYYLAGVQNYIIVDIASDQAPQLLAYRHTPAGYEEVEPDARGWVPLPVGGYWLSFSDNEEGALQIYDADGNLTRRPERFLIDINTAEQRADKEAERADKEKKAKEDALQRANEAIKLATELLKLAHDETARNQAVPRAEEYEQKLRALRALVEGPEAQAGSPSAPADTGLPPTS